MMKYLLILCMLMLSLNTNASNSSKEYDLLLNKLFKPDEPGGVALVVKDGKTVYRKATGMANLELDVAMTPDNIFRIGSISKQFTAVAILKLAEEGKLKLDDDITQYIEDYPSHGHTITIKHLLNHTSGIKSYTGMTKWDNEERKRDFTPSELIDYFKNEPIDFAPGEQFAYNNSGYVLLGYIIELVSGDSYAEYIRKQLFEPLGMSLSSYGSTSRIIKNRAYGYDKAEDIYKNADFLSMTQPYAAGSLLSTVDDIYTWYKAIANDEIISKKSRALAHKMGVLNNGENIDYGFGWFIGSLQGSPMIQHGGGINGFLTASLWLPEDEVFVAVFSNCNCNGPSDTAFKMAAVAIDKPYSWKKIELDDELMQAYQGIYERTPEDIRTIIFEDGQLYSLRSGGSRFEIYPYAKDKFFFKNSIVTLTFNRDSKDALTSVTLNSTGKAQDWRKTNKSISTFAEIELDEKVLLSYIGKYALSSNFNINIFKEENELYAQATGQDKVKLLAVAEKQLLLKNTDIKLTMNTNEDGTVESLTLHQNGEHLAKKVD